MLLVWDFLATSVAQPTCKVHPGRSTDAPATLDLSTERRVRSHTTAGKAPMGKPAFAGCRTDACMPRERLATKALIFGASRPQRALGCSTEQYLEPARRSARERHRHSTLCVNRSSRAQLRVLRHTRQAESPEASKPVKWLRQRYARRPCATRHPTATLGLTSPGSCCAWTDSSHSETHWISGVLLSFCRCAAFSACLRRNRFCNLAAAISMVNELPCLSCDGRCRQPLRRRSMLQPSV